MGRVKPTTRTDASVEFDATDPSASQRDAAVWSEATGDGHHDERVGTSTKTPPPRRLLDRFDRDLLHFAIVWAPYGGPPDDQTFAEFGIKPALLRARVHALAAAHLGGHLADEDRGLLVAAVNFIATYDPRRQAVRPLFAR
jgi:hypothetical protein